MATWTPLSKSGGYAYDSAVLYNSTHQYDWVAEIVWTAIAKS